MKILFVDDQYQGMDYYVKELRKEHHDVTFVDTVSGAIEAAKNEKFDLLILDLSMPPGPLRFEVKDDTTTGLVFLEKFRAIHPETPVLVLTNVNVPAVLNQLHGKYRVKVVGKMDVLPPDFPAIASDFAR